MDLPLEKRLMVLNALLLLGAGGLSFYLITAEREVPKEPPLEEIRGGLDRIAATAGRSSEEGEGSEEYPNFGVAPIFDTLIRMPTPTPTPPPTPVPPPNLAEATEHLKFNGAGAGLIFFVDRRTNEDLVVDMEKEGWRSQEVEHRGEMVPYRIVDVDEINVTVTLVYDEKGPRQEVVKSAFEE